MARTTYYPLRGGLDLVTPPPELPPGRVIAGANYEPAERGYRRMDGYERFDGSAKPSEATYAILRFSNGTTQVNAEDIVVGAESRFSAVALRNAVLESGSYGAGTAAGYIIVTEPIAGLINDDFLLDQGLLPPGYTLQRPGSRDFINSAGVLTQVGNDVPRITHFWNGSAWQRAGLLVEEQRINFLFNNVAAGAVPGTPGTLPTSWSLVNTSGLSTSVVGTGTEDGVNYFDFRIFGTPSSTTRISLRPQAIDSVAASLGGSWTFSSFLRRKAGSWTNFAANTVMQIAGWSGTSPTFVVEEFLELPLPLIIDDVQITRQRPQLTITMTKSATRFVSPCYLFSVTNGQTVDITIRIGLPQLDSGTSAASPIRNSGIRVVRAADTLTRTFATGFTSRTTLRRMDLRDNSIVTQELPPAVIGPSFVVGRSNAPLRSITFQNLDERRTSDFLFQAGEALEVLGSPVAVATDVASVRGAPDPDDDKEWFIEAVERARSRIKGVPGSGPVRGVWRYRGEVYAFRDSEDGSEGCMWRASGGGWLQQSLGFTVDFNQGSTEIQEGGVITGNSSGATATVNRVVVLSGDWTTNNAAGYLTLSNLQGGPLVPTEVVSGAGVATLTTASQRVRLAAGGKYRFVNHNFFGASSSKRMYAVNGVNRAMEWDGKALTLIRTGLPADLDKPQHIAVHEGALFLSIQGGLVKASATGEPTSFSALLGAAEFGTGADVTALLSGVSGALPIFGRDKISILFGSDPDTFRLETFASDSGAFQDSVAYAGTPVFVDSRGIRSLTASDTFGNFIRGSLSVAIEPLLHSRLRSARPRAAVRVRTKDQYRLFWDDSPTGIVMFLGREQPEFMAFRLDHMPFCVSSIDDEAENELLLMGGEDGFVYQLDAGTSFDGKPIRAYLRLAFNNLGSTTRQKRFDKAILEIDSAPTTTIGFTTEFSYGDPDFPATAEQMLQVFSVEGGGGFWEEANWDQFFWSTPAEGRATAFLAGLGENISLTIISEQTYEEPHTLTGATLHFHLRGLNR